MARSTLANCILIKDAMALAYHFCVKKKKNNYTNELLSIMKTNEIDCFDISEGKIIYTQSNVKKPINKQHLVECLTKYFEKNPNIPTDEVVQYILENRPTNVKESIRHKPIKNV